MDCKRVQSDGIAEKYLLGELSEPDIEAFERHYFECQRCFEEIENYRALQAELVKARQEILAEPVAQRRFWQSGWRIWMPVLAAVLVVLGLGWWLRKPVQPPLVVVAPPLEKPASPTLTELARVEAPRYAAPVLRGAADPAAQRFRGAMEHYSKGDYAAAIPGLRAAAARGQDPAAPRFYLGICYLLTDQTDPATEQLQRTIALGDTPYLEEAHYYLAKAHLRKGDVARAQDELSRTVQLRGDLEDPARKLLLEVQRLGQHPH